MEHYNGLQIDSDDIAIIGMNCRVPGANAPGELWENLKHGRESIITLHDDELRAAGVSESVLRDPNYIKSTAGLHGIDLFDASLFGFSPRDADVMDPQQRLFLECAWEAMELAGYSPQNCERVTGVYAGIGSNTYLLNLLADSTLVKSFGISSLVLSNPKDNLATLVAYKLNLSGPSITIQTASSTSLVCVHMACQGIQAGECDMALAGAVSLNLLRSEGYFYEEGGILSPDGHCRSFDSNAQGTVPASGLGIVMLKRLQLALADHDFIHAVIKGSAINNDGNLKLSYMAPSIEGQTKVIRAALAVSDVDPETISYVEAHGTATPIGDPIEIAALTQAFRASTEKKQFCAIGSVKTNLGHLDTASGVVGLIKTVLAMQNRQLPPSLHFLTPNPKIDFDLSPFFVNNRLRDWIGPIPLRAGVSSFGIGGTNAHVILEEAPRQEPLQSTSSSHLILLSAKTKTALEQARANLARHLRCHPNVRMEDVAYTLQVGRQHFNYRQIVACESREDALGALEKPAAEQVVSHSTNRERASIALLFPGQGSQFVGMGAELYWNELHFREVIDRCSERIRAVVGIDLREVLFCNPTSLDTGADVLRRADVIQPAIFMIEYALARQLEEWGITPDAVMGYGLGEYAAACVAGIMSEQEALDLVLIRGALSQHLPAGNMLAVEMGEQDLRSWLKPDVSLAAVNAPKQCVVSGSPVSIAELQERLCKEGILSQLLETSHACHSSMVEPILRDFASHVSKIGLRPPRVPLLSTVTGEWITDSEAQDPQYWVWNLRHQVQFASGIRKMTESSGIKILLEVGPGQTLTVLARRQIEEATVVPFILPRSECQSVLQSYLDSIGRLWLKGVNVEWSLFQRNAYRIPLPTYPFERRRHWAGVSRINSVSLSEQSTGIDRECYNNREFSGGDWRSQTKLPRGECPATDDCLKGSTASGWQRPELSSTYVEPRNDLEKALVGIWEQMLGMNGVGVEDNFSELGGDSLLAIQVCARIRALVEVDFAVGDLYERPTIAAAVESIVQMLIGNSPGEVERAIDAIYSVQSKET